MATKSIPVRATQVAATLTDFPVLVQPSQMTGWGAITLAEAESIRFYSDEALTTELAREVVGADNIWVRVPSLTPTTIIYADYDGLRPDYATTNTFGAENVWPLYEFVVHGQLNGDNLVDSCGRVTFVKESANTPTQTTGPFAGGITPNEAYWTSNYDSTRIGIGDFTFQHWNNFDPGPTTTNSGDRRVVCTVGAANTFADSFIAGVWENRSSWSFNNEYFMQFREGTAGTRDNRNSQPDVDGTWKKYSSGRTGSRSTTYVDSVKTYDDTDPEYNVNLGATCLLYTSPSPRDRTRSRMPSSA